MYNSGNFSPLVSYNNLVLNPLKGIPQSHPSDPSMFPYGVLPEKLRSAIDEVWKETHAPIPLVVSSALSALSMACQQLFDVRRPNGMVGPCSLFFITIADSGERKTSSDKFFSEPIRLFDNNSIEESERLQADFKINLEIWRLKDVGYKRNLQRLASKGGNLDEAELKIRKHGESYPKKPLEMRMLFDDVSPAAIMKSLHSRWPSVGILSDEAGKIFNSKTFENIGLYNKLWDGDSVSLDRSRSTDSYTVPSGRLTISLMSQQQTFREFLEKQGSLARDNGFLARCLTCWPISTQGTRQVNPNEAPIQSKSMPMLSEFRRVINLFLTKAKKQYHENQPRTIVSMSPEAARFWNNYYNSIESSIGTLGIFYDVRDGASKAAENIARMACILQAFESCDSNESWQISDNCINAAEHICNWYMVQYKNIYGSNSALSIDAQAANELMVWLDQRWAVQQDILIQKSLIRQYGPSKLRNKAALDRALSILVGQFRISILPLKAGDASKPTTYISKPTPINPSR